MPQNWLRNLFFSTLFYLINILVAASLLETEVITTEAITLETAYVDLTSVQKPPHLRQNTIVSKHKHLYYYHLTQRKNKNCRTAAKEAKTIMEDSQSPTKVSKSFYPTLDTFLLTKTYAKLLQNKSSKSFKHSSKYISRVCLKTFFSSPVT